jgi:hypothetical protein
MIITLVDNVLTRPDQARQIEVTPSQFLDMLADAENCPSLECRDENDKKAGSGFILAQYRPGATSKALKNLLKTSMTGILPFDIDSMTLEEVIKWLPLWQKYGCVLYSTFKHTADKPRFR